MNFQKKLMNLKKLVGKQTAYIYDTKEINVDEAY